MVHVPTIDCRVWNDSGVLIVHVLGLLTLASVDHLRRLMLANMSPEVNAVVLDLRKVVTAIAPEGWRKVAREAVIETPMAIVCSEAELHLATSHVAVTGQRGLPRLAFSELVDAFEWALRLSVQRGASLRSTRSGLRRADGCGK
jgi:hypothetical protein